MKSKRTALLTAGLTVLLCAAIIVGATFALFGTQKQREVTVTTGSVDIAAEFDTDSLTLYSLTPESTDAQPTGSLNFATGGSASIDGQNGSISLPQMVPGDKAEFTLLEGGEISFTVRGKEVVLKSGETYTYLLS